MVYEPKYKTHALFKMSKLHLQTKFSIYKNLENASPPPYPEADSAIKQCLFSKTVLNIHWAVPSNSTRIETAGVHVPQHKDGGPVAALHLLWYAVHPVIQRRG